MKPKPKPSPRRTGRLPLPPGAPRSRQINISLYPDEIAAIEAIGQGSITRGVRAMLAEREARKS